MKISINTSSAKEFISRANSIPTNKILPSLSNIKIDYKDGSWRMIKTNLEVVCVCKIIAEADDNSMALLINEQVLFSIIQTCNSENLTIEKGDNIKIHTGSAVVELPNEDQSSYPVIPEIATEDSFLLPPDYIRSIGIAAAYMSTDNHSGNYGFVHINNGMVYGFSNTFFYIKTGLEPLKNNVSFNKAECDIVVNLGDVYFTNKANHHIFHTDSFTYIFTKADSVQLSVSGVVERLMMPGKDMRVWKDGIISFCSLCNIVSESPLPVCYMETKEDGKLFLSLKDNNYNRSTEMELEATGGIDKFAFNSKLIINAFKSIPHEILNAKTNQNCLIISGENEWFCFIGLNQ